MPNEESIIMQEKNQGIQFPVSLRDYFAGEALVSLLGSMDRPQFDPEHDAEFCYRVADAMLAERAK